MNNSGFVEIALSYVYLDAGDWNGRYLCAVNELGWPRRSLLSQIIASYCQRNISYYQQAARLDAEARGYQAVDGPYYLALRNGLPRPQSDSRPRETHELRPYVGARPEVERSPLADAVIADEKQVGVPQAKKNRRTFKSVRTSGRNAAIIHLEMLLQEEKIVQTVSKMVVWHFATYWEQGSYRQQLLADAQQTLEPDLSGSNHFHCT